MGKDIKTSRNSTSHSIESNKYIPLYEDRMKSIRRYDSR